jgi:hypothetical protein
LFFLCGGGPPLRPPHRSQHRYWSGEPYSTSVASLYVASPDIRPAELAA